MDHTDCNCDQVLAMRSEARELAARIEDHIEDHSGPYREHEEETWRLLTELQVLLEHM